MQPEVFGEEGEETPRWPVVGKEMRSIPEPFVSKDCAEERSTEPMALVRGGDVEVEETKG